MTLNILAIGAHPDDIELGCGGSLAKLARAGSRIHALVLSRGGRGCHAGIDRSEESHRALRRLGVAEVIQKDFPDTRFPACRNDIIASIEQACAVIGPGRVYTMCGEDHHQDHRTVHEAMVQGVILATHRVDAAWSDRKRTRLNSRPSQISYSG